MLYNICMNLEVISTKPLALKQRTGTGQHQNRCPVALNLFTAEGASSGEGNHDSSVSQD
jgi:hypothetical protein